MEAQAQIDWVRRLTNNDLLQADADIANLNAELTATEGEVAAHAGPGSRPSLTLDGTFNETQALSLF